MFGLSSHLGSPWPGRAGQRLLERRLDEAERRFRSSFEEAPIGMALVAPWGTFLRANRQLCEMLGYSHQSLCSLSFQELTHPDDLGADLELVAGVLAGELRTYRMDKRYYRSDGRVVWATLSVSLVRDPDGEPLYFIAQVEDISERKRAEQGLREAEERFRRAFDDAPIGMLITGVDGRLERVNRQLCELLGYSQEQLESTSLGSLVHPDDLGESQRASRAMLVGELERHQVEKRFLHADGHVVPVELTSTLVRDPDGEPLHFLSQIQDITERKRFQGQLQYLADHDTLTGLFNRRRFEEELSRELARAERYGTGAAVLAIDVDDFKYINDSLGHSAGDELIARVGDTLRGRLRRTDVLARLGGDEFAVLVPRVGHAEALELAEALLDGIRSLDSSRWGGRRTRVTASIGVALFDGAATLSAEELLVEADIAMYDAKEAGRDRAVVYDAGEDRQERMQARLTWVERIRAALDQDAFELHGQPVVSLTGDPRPRYELLVRMLGQTDEVIPPGSFLFIAERFDLIQQIDRWVVTRAIRLLAELQGAGSDVCLEVNLSAKSVTDPKLPELIAAELAATGADAGGLCIEITETAAIVNIDRAKLFARRLAELGCAFALDDFGAGFASFYYLKHLSFDFLKIDGEFVKDLTTDVTNQLVVKSVVDIARGLGKRTIAEFVEDAQTLELLRTMGVDYAQGYFVAKPRPLVELDLAAVSTAAVAG